MSTNDGFNWTLQEPLNDPICLDDWSGCTIMTRAMLPRYEHTTTLDLDGTTLIVTGGTYGRNGPGTDFDGLYAQMWKLTNAGRNWTFTRPTTSETMPPRFRGAASIMTNQNELYIFGGITNGHYTRFQCPKYIWIGISSSQGRYTSWYRWGYTNYYSSGITSCWQHSVFIEPTNGNWIHMGGQGENLQYTNEIYQSTDKGLTWTLNNPNPAWSPRGRMNIGIDSSTKNIIMYGGCNAVTCFTDAWYSPAGSNGNQWYMLTPSLSTLDQSANQLMLLNALIKPRYPILANINGKRNNVILAITNETDIFNLYGTPSSQVGRDRTIRTGLNVLDYQSFIACSIPTVTFTSSQSVTLTIGQVVHFMVTTSGFSNPPQYTIVNGILPMGLTLNSMTGLLSGTPTGIGGRFTIGILASNSFDPKRITQQFTITLNQPATIITPIATATFLAESNSNQYQIDTIGYPSPSFTIINNNNTSLPNGLIFNSNTGIISGTPMSGTGGEYMIEITASNNIGNSTKQTLTIIVNEHVIIDPSSTHHYTMVEGEYNSINIPIHAHRYPVSVTFDLNGVLPAGLVFNNITGIISGTPTIHSHGIYTMFISVSNGILPISTQMHTLVVTAPNLSAATQIQTSIIHFVILAILLLLFSF